MIVNLWGFAFPLVLRTCLILNFLILILHSNQTGQLMHQLLIAHHDQRVLDSLPWISTKQAIESGSHTLWGFWLPIDFDTDIMDSAASRTAALHHRNNAVPSEAVLAVLYQRRNGLPPSADSRTIQGTLLTLLLGLLSTFLIASGTSPALPRPNT